MTTDTKELLILAAKAAGYWDQTSFVSYDHRGAYFCTPSKPEPRSEPFVWRPLQDDGDLHRLARELKMRIFFDLGWVAIPIPGEASDIFECFTPGDKEEEALAIVRAAAAMGKEMGE